MDINILFLVSGNGGNLKFVFNSLKHGRIKNVQLFVIADRNCGAFDYALNNGITSYKVKYKIDSDNDLFDHISLIKPDLIITNIHKILSKRIVEEFSDIMINLHYSLLPSYKGLIGTKPIELAFNESKFIGATVHDVSVDVDSGKIIKQGLVRKIEDLSYITNMVFRVGCIILIDTIVSRFPHISTQGISEYDDSYDSMIFSSKLKINPSFYDEAFWKNL